jgi:serine/threonine protein kinase
VDWWALGCILFECIIGRVPFKMYDDEPAVSRLAADGVVVANPVGSALDIHRQGRLVRRSAQDTDRFAGWGDVESARRREWHPLVRLTPAAAERAHIPHHRALHQASPVLYRCVSVRHVHH